MPDVGVLELQIRDNSQSAGQGLGYLSDALVAVKNAVKGGLNLSSGEKSVATQIKNLSDAVKSNSTVIKNLGTLFNALSNFAKLKDVTINTEPITTLQTALKDGINIGKAGTEINKLREALTEKWPDTKQVEFVAGSMVNLSKAATAMAAGNTAATVKAVAKSIDEYATAVGKVSGGGAHDYLQQQIFASVANIETSKAAETKAAVEEIKETASVYEEQVDRIKNASSGGWASAWRTQMYSSDASQGSGGLKKTTEVIQESTEAITGFKESVADMSAPVKQLDLDKYISSPLESIAYKATMGGTAMERFWDTFAHAPTTMSVSGIEKAIADTAKLAKAEINSLIETLKKPIKYKGLDEFINAKTGVTSGAQGAGLINENTTMLGQVLEQQEALERMKHSADEATEAQIKLNDAGRAVAGTVRLYDSIDQQWKETYIDTEKVKDSTGAITENVREAAGQISSFVNLLEVPASGKNGVFANASEELTSLYEKIAQVKAEQEQWLNINEKAATQLKYGGPRSKEDLGFDLKHSEEGYYAALEAEKQYEEAIRDLLGYANEYTANAREATTATNEQAESMKVLADATNSVNDAMQQNSASVSFINEAKANANRMAIQQLFDTLENPPQVKTSDIIDNLTGVGREALDAKASMSAFLELMQQDNDYTRHIRELNPELAELSDKVQEAGGHFNDLKEAEELAAESIKGVSGSFKDFTAGLKKAFPLISRIGTQLKNIMIRRTITAALRSIVSGAKEGIQHMYEYSKLINSSFAPSMDAAASSIAQMKNALGAALAPVLQSLIPILQNVINWFINLINYVNQFFALLRGQSTWTRAMPQTVSAFEKQEKAAKKTGSAIKDLLADWDELNIIQSNTSGAGSGAGTSEAEDYLSMFEEVDKFDSKVKDVVNFIKDNFDMILTSAIAIRAAMTAWRLSSAFEKTLPFLSTLMQGIVLGATIALTITITDLLGKAYIDSGSPAYLIADALTGAVGAELAGSIAAKIAGTTAGTITKGFVLILSGAVNIKNAATAAAQEKDAEAWMLGILGSAEVGIGAGVTAFGAGATVAGSLAGGLVVGLAAITITAAVILEAKKKASYRKMAIDAFRSHTEGGISPQAYMAALQHRLDELTSQSKLVVEASLGLDEHTESFTKTIESLKTLNGLVTGDGKLTTEEANKFKDAWEIIVNELENISHVNYETIYAGLSEAIANGSEEIKNAALQARADAIEVAGIMGGAQAKLEKEMEFLTNAITSGTATEDDIARYKEIYEVLAGETESGIKELQQALTEGAGFDFSGAEKPVEAAVEFIKGMNADLIQPALDSVQAQYDAEIQAVQESQEDLEKWRKLYPDYITDDVYKDLKEYYDGLIELYTTRLEDQKKEIVGSTQDAFNTLLDQALAGYFDIKQDDEYALDTYVESVFNPIVKAIEEAGGEVPDKIKAVLARGGKNAVEAAAVEIARSAGREGIYESFFEDESIEFPVHFAVNYELDLVKQDPSKIGEDTAKEIVTSMFKVFDDPETIINSLGTGFGWSVEDIIGYLNLDELDEEQLSDLLDVIEYLKSVQEESLFANYNSSPNAPGHIDWYQYQEELSKLNETYASVQEKIKTAMDGKNLNDEVISDKTGKIAQDYKNMADSILYDLGRLNGAGFDLSTQGMSGHINAYIPKAATGGFVKSGDLIMANENGNIEMMGKMGNQPVVANNQQIVNGISQGVAQANTGVESRLTTIETLLNRILSKEFVAKAVPGSSWGGFNVQSGASWEKVTG